MQAETPMAESVGTDAGTPPRSFYIIGALALLWNLLGVSAFVMQVTSTPTALGETPEQVAFYQQFPSWAVSAFAVATFGGALACVLLLLRNKQAIPVFTVSLLGLIAQNVYSFGLGNGLAAFGAGALGLPVMIAVVAIAMLVYAMRALGRGWLK